MKLNKKYIVSFELIFNNKVYGATTRQVWATNRLEAMRKIKRGFKFGNNKVKITKIISLK